MTRCRALQTLQGPYLFILYNFDLLRDSGFTYVKYADDMSLILKIIDDQCLQDRLQNIFNRIKNACAKFDFVLNTTKSKLLTKSKLCPRPIPEVQMSMNCNCLVGLSLLLLISNAANTF